jgi:hypothetical protein
MQIFERLANGQFTLKSHLVGLEMDNTKTEREFPDG